MDVLSLDIIDFNRLNGHWSNSADALKTIFSWFDGMAVVTVAELQNYIKAPGRDDWPGWDHVGSHEDVGKSYWNWFWWNHPKGELYFSDAPDFYGKFEDGSRFWGDVGRVSASTFAYTQKMLRKHDLWISLLGDGSRQVLIEPLVDINKLFSELVPYERRLAQTAS